MACLSDLAIKRKMADSVSFMAFPGFPKPFPDSRTVCLFKEPMTNAGMDRIVLAELQIRLNVLKLKVKRGTIQDATFIEADHGSSKKPQGDEAKTCCIKRGTKVNRNPLEP